MRTLIALGVLPFIFFPLVCSAVKLECERKFGDGSEGPEFIDTNIKRTGRDWTVDEDKYEIKYEYNGSINIETIYRSSGRCEYYFSHPNGTTMSAHGICKPVGKKKF